MMFKRLRVQAEPKKTAPDLGDISIAQLIGDASLPVTIRIYATTRSWFRRVQVAPGLQGIPWSSS